MKSTRPLVLLLLILVFGISGYGQTIRFQNSILGGLGAATNGLNLSGSTIHPNTAGGNTMSSTSDLVLPPNSTIVKAILYVEGYANPINQIKFSFPGSGGLQTFTTASPGFLGNPTTGSYSQFILDVSTLIPNDGYTSSVIAGGNPNPEGRYAIADVTPYDAGNYGYGWTLLVAYVNPNATYRNVTIADNCSNFGVGAASTILVPNIIVPAIGPINAIVLATGCWGDPNPLLYPDYIEFGEQGTGLTRLNDPVSGANNDILNSTVGFSVPNNVTDDGVVGMASGNFVARNPYNTFAGTNGSAEYFDCDLMDASGILNPDPNPITIQITQGAPITSNDALGVGAYGISVDIAAAVLTKSLSPTEITDGGVATYTFTIDNNRAGAIDLTNIAFNDNIPAGLQIATPNCVAVSGGTGGTVTANPGSNSFSLTGLDLLAGDVATITLCVTNVPGQFNPECGTNPAAFTNGFLNISGNTENLANAVTDQCLIILDLLAGFEADTVCAGNPTSFTDTSVVSASTTITNWEWDFGVTPTQNGSAQHPTFVYPAAGDYTAQLIVTFSNGKKDTVQGPVHVKPNPVGSVGPDETICEGDSTQLSASGGDTYAWSGGPITGSNTDQPIVFPNSTSTYDVRITDSSTKCFVDTFVVVTVNPKPTPTITGPNAICSGTSTSLLAGGGDSYTWNPGGISGDNITISPSSDSTITLVADLAGCIDSISLTISVETPPEAGTGGLDTICSNGQTIDLNQYVSGNDPGGVWSAESGGGTLDANTGSLASAPFEEDDFVFYYIAKAVQYCPDDSATIEIAYFEPPRITLNEIPGLCEGSDAQIPLEISGSNDPFTVKILENGTELEFDNLNDNPTISLPVDPQKVYAITYVESSPYLCSQDTLIPLVFDLKTPPSIEVVSIDCNPENTQYQVTLSFSGGDPGSYVLNDNITPNGNPHISDWINSGSDFEFWISDQFACEPVDSVSGIFTCACPTLAGTMDTDTLIEVCVDGTATATHLGGHYLDINDTLSFVLHDKSGSSLGTVFASSENPSFPFDSGTMTTGVTYYISAVAGDSLPNGMVDLSNPNGCMKVANGVPVIFHPLPIISVTDIDPLVCPNTDAAFLVTLTTGKEGFTVADPFQTIISQSSGFTDTLLISSGQDSTVYLETVVDGNGCISTYSPALEANITHLDSLIMDVEYYNCNSSNTRFTIGVDVIQGDAASLTFTGTPNGTISNGVFTSDEIDNYTNYNLAFSDGNACNSVPVVGNYSCPCGSEAGQMEDGSTTAIAEVCVENLFSPNPIDLDNNGIPDHYIGDGNDTLSYIVVETMDDTLSQNPPYVAISSTPSFAYNAATMSYNHTYFVVPVAGDVNPATGLVDFNAPGCKDYSDGTPFKWIKPAEVALSAPAEICEGTPLNLAATVEANKGLSYTLIHDQGFSEAHFDTTSTANKSISGLLPGNYTFSVDTIAQTLVDGTTPVGCKGYWTSAPVTVRVIPTPTAAFEAPLNMTICAGESPQIGLVFTGEDQISATANTLGTYTAAAGSYPDAFVPTLLDSISYSLTNVQSVSPQGTVCPGTWDGLTKDLNVNAIPTGSASLDVDTICINESIEVNFVGSGDQPEYTLFAEHNGNPFSVTSSGGIFSPMTISPTDNGSIRLTSISDQTISDVSGGACIGTLNQVLNYVVNPLPTVAINAISENLLCLGDSTLIDFAFSGRAPFQFNFVDNLTGQNISFPDTPYGFEWNYAPTQTVELIGGTVTDANGCVNQVDQTVHIIEVREKPIPSYRWDTKEGCVPFQPHLINTTDPSTYVSCNWLANGTGELGSSCADFLPVFTRAGRSAITLTLTNDAGCVGVYEVPDFIAHPKPVAQFDINPTSPTVMSSTVAFFNTSLHGTSQTWLFDTLGTSSLPNPEFAFPGIANQVFEVELAVASDFGCTDTIVKAIKISPDFSVFLPNAFTPDGDNVNDVYIPVLSGIEFTGYQFRIFDRWGKLVFETKDQTEGWDGLLPDGKQAPVGIYAVVVKGRVDGEAYSAEFDGMVQLIR